MTFRPLAWLVATACLLLTLSAPETALAEDLIVEHSPTDPSHFSSIQAAINHAAAVLNSPFPTSTNFRVVVKADSLPYQGTITPISNVPIIGSSTSGTFLTGSGSGPVISLNNVSSVLIRNFTFRSATVGILVANSSSIDITNNVFQLGKAGTAIRIQGSPTASIINNTFYNNQTAISTDSNVTITNDIFSDNNVALAAQVPLTLLSYNDFFNNLSDGVANRGVHSIPNSQVLNGDPRFVDPAEGDFHLQPDSPAANSGNPKYANSFDDSTFDMGAFGGPDSDTVLAALTGLDSVLTAPSTIALRWNPSSTGEVTAYRVYYGTSSGDYSGTQAQEGISPITVPVGTTTATLSNLPVTSPTPLAAPVLRVTPLNRALQLDWSAVPGATGYRIYYSTTAFDAASLPATPAPIEVTAGKTTYPLSGLNNGQTYFVALSALAQNRFFAAVTQVIDSSVPSKPGSANESNFSRETSQAVGPTRESSISAVLSDFPESISPVPALKSEGCFIATAAYGCYSAPQVQLLRDFRDRYLKSNSAGRAFVAWYYRHGPKGARFLNDHPWLKPPVRLALLPLVAGSMFLINTSPLAQAAIFASAIMLLSGFLYRRMLSKKLSHTGGLS